MADQNKSILLRSTPLDMALVALASGQKGLSPTEAWFGPQSPIPPTAPEDTKGRSRDYGFGFNLQFAPRAEQGENAIDFQTLRALADPAQGGFGLLRLAIETCKNQMAGQKGTILPVDRQDKSPAMMKECQRVKDLFKRPDGRLLFSRWRRKILEDHLVLDHPVIYLAPTAKKGIMLPRVISGDTMKLVIDGKGDIQAGKAVAFQQKLHGMPAVNYIGDEIIYAPYNPVPHRAYGYGPVEQFLDYINFAMRRSASMTEFYTSGNMPDALIGCPPEWNPTQVAEMQAYWDAIHEGNQAARRHARFVPGAMKVERIPEPNLKTDVDEWLARVICWCFSLSPSALVKDNNRATASTAKQTAQEEGLEPRKEWESELLTEVASRAFGAQDCEYGYEDEEITDPKVKAEVIQFAMGGPGKAWITVDEARERVGLPVLTQEQKDELNPPPPPPPVLNPGMGAPDAAAQPGATGKAAAEPGAKVDKGAAPKVGEAQTKLKKAKKVKRIKRDRPARTLAQDAIEKLFVQRLAAQKKVALKGLAKIVKKIAKAEGTDDYADVWDDIRAGDDEFTAKFAKVLAAAAADGSNEALRQVLDDPSNPMFHQANEDAITWAGDHAAEAVKGVDDTTVQGLRDLIIKALEDGTSGADLADLVSDFTGFDSSRAEKIARTETANADVAGNLKGWKASGVVSKKEWYPDADPCDVCQANADQGPIDLDASFESGDDGPTAHPFCECDVLPVLDEEE